MSVLIKKVNKIILLICLSLCLHSETFSQDKVTIVFANDGHTNPYHVEWLAGFESALKAYNKEFGNIEGYWLSATNLEDQLLQIEKEIEKDVDILFVNSINVEAFRPLVKRAKEKGIIWISVHNHMEFADYNFALGDFDNGLKQGLALGAYYNGNAKIAIMLGMRGNTSGEERLRGILTGLSNYPEIDVLAQEPADWSSAKAIGISERWYKQFPSIDAISVVTDTYLYPAADIAKKMGLSEVNFFGYDGDLEILNRMKNSKSIKSDILLGANREGWSFVHLAYRIYKKLPVEKIYNFYTPLVLSKDTYKRCLKNGFPKNIKVITPNEAINLSKKGQLEFGPKNFINKSKN
jgi:ABC-type sugar transport system substrate-binding protein